MKKYSVMILICTLGLLQPGRAVAQSEAAAESVTKLSSESQLLTELGPALARHPRLLAAQEEVEQAREEMRLAEGKLWPQLSWNTQATLGNIQRMSLPVPGVEPMNMSMRPSGASVNLAVTALMPVYTGGRLETELASARQRLRTARLNWQLEQQALWRELRQNLLELAWIQARAELLETLQRWHLEMLHLSQEQFQQGKIPRYLLLRSQSDLQVLEVESEALRLEARQHKLALHQLLSGAGGPAQIPSLKIPDTLPVLGDVSTWISLVLERSPEIQVSAQKLKEAEIRVNWAQTSYFPFVYLAAVYEQRLPESPMMQMTSGGAVDLLIAWPVFDGFQREAQLRLYQSQARQRLAEYTDLQNRLKTRVEQLGAEQQTRLAQLKAQAALCANLEEELRIARLRLENGKGLVLEVLEYLGRLQTARLNQLQSWLGFLRVRLELDEMMGLAAPETGLEHS